MPPVEANLHDWCNRAQHLGTSCASGARELAQQRGIGAIRSLMGLVSLVERHGQGAVNRACAKTSARGTWRLRNVATPLQSQETQAQLPFDEHHPLIRNLSEHGRTQTQTP